MECSGKVQVGGPASAGAMKRSGMEVNGIGAGAFALYLLPLCCSAISLPGGFVGSLEACWHLGQAAMGSAAWHWCTFGEPLVLLFKSNWCRQHKQSALSLSRAPHGVL